MYRLHFMGTELALEDGVFQMQSTFSVSTNPNFRFTFGRGADNSLDVVVKDTDGAVFSAQSEPSGS